MTGSFLFFLLIGVLITTGIDGQTNDVSLSIVPDSVDSGNNSVEMTCSYPGLGGTNLTGVEWTALGNSMFLYFPDGGSSGPQGDYVGRVTQKDVNEISHTIEMTGTNWCVDLGEYRCDVGSSVDSDYDIATITAEEPQFEEFLCDDGPCPDSEVEPPDNMKVECSFLYNQEMEVTLDGPDGSQDSGGDLTGQDSCTYRRWATLDLSPEGGDLTITCTAKHGDEETEPHTLVLKFASGGNGVGQTTGTLLASILAVAVIRGIM